MKTILQKNWFSVVLSPIMLGTALFGGVQAALADVTVCNKVQEPVWAAIAWSQNNDYTSHGWWKIYPGKCTQVYSPQSVGPFWIHVHTLIVDGRRISWGTGQTFAVDRKEFTYAKAHRIDPSDETEEFSQVNSQQRYARITYTVNSDLTSTTEIRPY